MAEAAAQAPVSEEVKNCPACKKPLKKARRFYRNGAYYCNNNCFKKAQAAAKSTKPQAAPEGALAADTSEQPDNKAEAKS